MSKLQLKVLLVEDDTDIAFLVKANIEKHFDNVTISITDTIEETLDILHKNNYDFDIILLDYLLGNVTGLEILEKVREVTQIPVVIITGQGSEEVAVKAMKLGASDYIVKRGHFFNQIPEAIKKVVKLKPKYDTDKIFLAFYRFGKSGTEPIYLKNLPAEYVNNKETVTLSLGVLLFTLFGMGEIDKIDDGSIISGPVRIPKMKDYSATSFLYVLKDKGQEDSRFSGKDYCIVALAYPADYESLVYEINKIQNVLSAFFGDIEDISEVKGKAEQVEKKIYNIISRF